MTHTTPGHDDGTRVAAALTELALGHMVVVVDDEDREDEGDLILAAELADPAALGFMIRHSSGLVCVSLPDERADELELPLMVAAGDDPRGTAFTVTVDLKAGTTTGVSAADRTATIRALAAPETPPDALSRPGHVLPLRARPGGVLSRRGHTEAAGDLCCLAGLRPIGVLSEITNDDGTMARGRQLTRFAADHGLVTISVADIVAYRIRHEVLVQRESCARLPTRHGEFTAMTYRSAVDDSEHLALVLGDVADVAAPVLVRVHSECLTGEVLGSRRCDCGEQLEQAMARIGAEGRGIVVYLRGHEGRGIGLSAKLRAYALQDRGMDTVDANLAQGLPIDSRDYTAAAHILRDLGVAELRLLTNNPDKHQQLADAGVRIAAREPLLTVPTAEDAAYLHTKRTRLHHTLKADPLTTAAS